MNCTIHEIDSLPAQMYDILHLHLHLLALYFIYFTRVQIFVHHLILERGPVCIDELGISKHATAPQPFFMFFTFIQPACEARGPEGPAR